MSADFSFKKLNIDERKEIGTVMATVVCGSLIAIIKLLQENLPKLPDEAIWEATARDPVP